MERTSTRTFSPLIKDHVLLEFATALNKAASVLKIHLNTDKIVEIKLD